MMSALSPLVVLTIICSTMALVAVGFTLAAIFVPGFATAGTTMATIILGALGTTSTTMFGTYLVRGLQRSAAEEANKTVEEEGANVP